MHHEIDDYESLLHALLSARSMANVSIIRAMT